MHSVITKVLFNIPKWLRWIIFLSYLAFLVYSSLTSGIRVPRLLLFANADKLIHFLMYFIFASLALWSLDTSPRSLDYFLQKRKYALVLIMAFTWGTIMELFQRFLVSGRQFSYWDILANLLGAVMGIFLFYFLFANVNPKSVHREIP